jgi:protoporphyrin/coproporphyrin ferrochelatase
VSPEPLTGIVCMAYGSPATEADIEAYFTHIRGGRPPTREALDDLVSRYRAIGGSPLTEITRAQAAALGELTAMPAFAGMKHAPPLIADAVAQAREAGVRRLVGLPLAPHFARMSLGGYESALRQAWVEELVFIPGFHDHPVQGLLEKALTDAPAERVFFTAHSLPARITAEGDPYLSQLLESCRLVAAGIDMPPWEFAFQSASHTGEPWLGPDLLEAITGSGARDVLVCPIGFVADHLEILYDLDVEAQAYAREKGIRLRRTESFNARPEFIAALGEVVAGALRSVSSPARS